MTFAEKMDQYLDRYSSLYQFSGMFRVTQKDQIIYQRNVGFADREHKVPFTNDSVFTLYSMSKPFCVIAVMTLAEKGLVNLQDFPLLMHIDEIITQKKAVNIPWDKFTFER